MPSLDHESLGCRIVLGIDPGTATMGYGVVVGCPDGFSCVAYGALTTPPDEPMSERLLRLHDGLLALIRDYRPDSVAVERLYFSRNVSTALSVGQARGVTLLAAAESGLPVCEYSPQQIKQAVAIWGRAPKIQVQQTVRILLGLDRDPQPDDAADALALAICHLQLSQVDATLKRLSGG